MIVTLAATSLVQVVAAVSFALVGRAYNKRGAGAGGAGSAFVAWWWGMSAYMTLQSALGMLAAFGRESVGVWVVGFYASIFTLCVSAWGIAYFVAFLFTGKAWLGKLFGVYFAFAGAAFVWIAILQNATTVRVSALAAKLDPPPPGLTIVYVLFAIPLVVSVVAYLTLIWKVHDSLQRYRIALSGGAVLLWIVGGFAANVGSSDLWKFLSVTGVGLLTASSVMLAYYPPQAILARFDARLRRERRTAFVGRVSELV